MTSPAIKLAKECGGMVVPSGTLFLPEELERFYALAQAHALRDAAEKFDFDCDCGFPCDCYGPSTSKFQAIRMAEELERVA